MRENRQHGSEGGEAKAFPTPIAAGGASVNGQAGMPADFRVEDHGPRQLRTTTLRGLVFGTFDPDIPPIEDFVGSEVLAQMKRVIDGMRIAIIGRSTEVLPNNWKMYAENMRDSFHASLLHLFFATFKINRLSQGGGLIVSPNRGCGVSSTIGPTMPTTPPTQVCVRPPTTIHWKTPA